VRAKFSSGGALCFVLVLVGCGGGSGGAGGGTGGTGGGSGNSAPAVQLSPQSLTFSSQNIDSASAAQTVTLTNSGNAALAISAFSATGDFKQTNNCPTSLAAAASCALQVTFTPSATGSRTGAISVTDNAPASPQSIQLSGTGGAALFYVATNGSDAWSGTLPAPNANSSDGPFATVDHARAVVRALNKTGLTQVTVQIRQGTYFLPPAPTGQTTSLLFTSADSGTSASEIVYENYPGETPVISGGIRVTKWTNTTGDTWTATLPSGTAYFENLFYNGARRLRPRVNGALGGSPYLRVFAQVFSQTATANCPQYATVSGFTGYECFDRFQYCDPTTSGQATSCNTSSVTNTWANLTPPKSQNPCAAPQPAGNGAPVGDIELLDFEQFSTSKLLVNCIDTTNGIIYLTGPTTISKSNYTEAGFILNHRYVIENVKNALTESGQWFLDRSTSSPSYPNMTLTYIANAGENPNTDTVIVPQLQQVLVASNLQYVTFRGLTFAHDNFTVPSPQGYVSTELEPAVTSAVSFQNSQNLVFDSNIVTETSGNGIEIISCTDNVDSPSQSPSWCVGTPTPSAVTANIVVENSAFYEIGANGIRVGEPGIVGVDTDSNVPHGITVQNNVVEGYGRVFPAAFGIGQGMGNNNLYTHNDVYDGYHCAISISENVPDNQTPGGHGDFSNSISFNHVYNLLQGIMNDGGAIRIEDGNNMAIAANNSILNNKIHDVSDASIQDSDGYGGHGIYMDNESGQVDVERNLVYRVSDATIYTPHGPQIAPPAGMTNANTIRNNILAYAIKAMVETGDPYQNGVPASPNQMFELTDNIFYFDRNETSTSPFQNTTEANGFNVQGGCTYSVGFPGTPYADFQSFNNNLYWRTDGKFLTYTHGFHVQTTAGALPGDPNAPCSQNRGDWTYYTFANWVGLGEDANSVANQDPYPSNPDPTQYPSDNFSSPNAPAGLGFVSFDPTQAGRSNPVLQPPPVAPTFQTQIFNPATDF